MLEDELSIRSYEIAATNSKIKDIDTMITILKMQDANETDISKKNDINASIAYYKSEKVRLKKFIEDTKAELLELIRFNAAQRKGN